MGSFTQGGIALGQSLGGGIENYVAGRERRELLVGKALGIQKQLLNDDKRTDEDNKYLKKFDDVNELGTRQLQSLISEFETGEELQMMGMKRKILQSQVADAEAKAQSRQGLADFTSKGYGETEAGFEGDAWAVPEYLTRDYLAGDRGQKDIAAGAFPGEHYGDESRAVYEDYSTGGEETDRPPSAGAIEATRNSDFLDRSNLESWRLEALKRGGESNAKKAVRKKQASLNKGIEDLEGYFDRNPGLRPSEGNQDYGSARELASKQGELEALKAENPWLIPSELKGLDPLVVPDTMADAPPLQPEAVGPEQTQQRLVGYETYGDVDLASQQPLDRYAVTGGTPSTPTDERRGQLIDSLAQYNLTPADRKQAIDMISEKYPKLKEIATGVESPDGKSLGFTIGNTFIPARQTVGTAGAGTEGLELTSITLNDKGEVTRIMKPKEDLEKGQKVLLANAKEFKHQAEKLLKVVDSHGNWESAFSAFFSDSSATAKAELDSLAFRMAILYSKIVDPDTAAREGEVVAAKKYAFQMGFFTPNGVTKASVNSMLAEVMRRESSLYEQEGIEAPQAKGAGAATNPADQLGIMK